MSKPKIGILNSGGDCAGLNAVLSAAVKTGHRDYDFIGIHRGLEGLIESDSDVELSRDMVRGIAHTGGTILVTTNRGHMGGKNKDGRTKQIESKYVEQALNKYKELELEALIVIGGDGSLTSALQLQQAGMNIIGVPKTIDNDLQATQRTFGFESAVEIVTEALDRIHTTARSHQRVMIVETMGRNAGWIALHGGIAGGADIILIPEIPFTYQRLEAEIQARAHRGRHETIIVVAEGAQPADGSGPIYSDTSLVGGKGEYRLGGIAQQISSYLEKSLPEFENRYVRLGHIQRGGAPTSDDRVLAFMYGAYAVELARDKKYGQMVCWDGSKLGSVELEAAVDGIKLVDPDNDLVRLAKKSGVCFGDQ